MHPFNLPVNIGQRSMMPHTVGDTQMNKMRRNKTCPKIRCSMSDMKEPMSSVLHSLEGWNYQSLRWETRERKACVERVRVGHEWG
jgi:hypothetical protein